MNNPGEKDDPVYDPSKVQYLCYQLEKGEKGTPHYQGVCQFRDKNTTMSKAKEIVGARAHLEKMHGSPEQAIDYCKKEDTRVRGPWEFGEYLKKGSNKRKRADIEAEYEADPESFHLRDPDMAARIKARRRCQQFMDGGRWSLDKMDRPWQVRLRKELEQAPDERTVHWVYGPEGNEGKTTFLKCLAREGWMCLTASSSVDMKYLYMVNGMDKHLVIDVPRRVERASYKAIYSVVEEVKNRFITSTKYRPLSVMDDQCVHVVVMSNKLPDKEMLSRDRICMHNLSEEKEEFDCVDFDYVKLK